MGPLAGFRLAAFSASSRARCSADRMVSRSAAKPACMAPLSACDRYMPATRLVPRSACAGCSASRSRQPPRGGQQIAGGDRLRGEPQLDRQLRGYPVAGVEVLPRPQDRGEQRPERRAAVARHQAHRHVRVRQEPAIGDEDDVAEHGHAAPQPDRGPVDRGDHRQREAQQLLDDLRALAQALVAGHRIVEEGGDPAQVAARAERPPRAGEDHHPGAGVGGELPPDVGEGPVQRLVDGVELGWPVEGDDAERPLARDGQLRGEIVAVTH